MLFIRFIDCWIRVAVPDFSQIGSGRRRFTSSDSFLRKMLVRKFSWLVVVVLFPLLGMSAGLLLGEEERPKPNLVLILADDLGWQDVKCYDLDEPSPYDTPHLDALAKKGVMFWQGYSPAPTCAPSRCAILSGVHPARAQKTHVKGGVPPTPRSVRNPMMDPWYSGRMPEDTVTLAKALKADGYYTGHVGKWHIAIDHAAFPQPKDVGFDFTRSSRGAHSRMPNRLEGFATSEEGDPFRLDGNGFPFHQNNEDALDFLRQHKEEPFFLYYATWLVHSPMVTRNEALLRKYEKRMGASLTNLDTPAVSGQRNPFYGAMVESLDYYVGQVISYLETTDDPRWPGHKLNENTYLIFTSDNGGMEGGSKERYTDNNPSGPRKDFSQGRGHSCSSSHHWAWDCEGSGIPGDGQWARFLSHPPFPGRCEQARGQAA